MLVLLYIVSCIKTYQWSYKKYKLRRVSASFSKMPIKLKTYLLFKLNRSRSSSCNKRILLPDLWRQCWFGVTCGRPNYERSCWKSNSTFWTDSFSGKISTIMLANIVWKIYPWYIGLVCHFNSYIILFGSSWWSPIRLDPLPCTSLLWCSRRFQMMFVWSWSFFRIRRYATSQQIHFRNCRYPQL